MYRINKHNSTNGRFAMLARMGEVVFHAKDAARIWGIWNPNTLNMTLSRYASKGLLFRISKGLYSVKPIDSLSPYLIGTKSLGISYVTCESVLFSEGLINQAPKEITLVSQRSRRFIIQGKRYRSRQLQDKYLFNDAGIINKDGVYVATPVRAVADMLYFNPKKYFDADVDWKAVGDIAKKIGYNIDIPK